MELLSVVGVFSGLLSAVSAATAIYISVQTSRRQERHQRDTLDWQKEQSRAQLKLTMDAKMLDWATRALGSLNEIEMFLLSASEQPEVRRHRKSQLLCTLSELVDEGRWHMPNHTDPNKPDHGQEKGAAYAGYRTRALDVLVYVYDRFKAFEAAGKLSSDDLIARLHDSKKQFVSEVFTRIDPKRFLELIGRPQEPPTWMNAAKEAQA